MPTYQCTAAAGLLDAGKKSAIAAEITRIHNAVTGAASFFAQVIFTDVPKTSPIAAAILSSVWALSQISVKIARKPELFAGAMMLMAIAISYTFVLTPYMSGLGLDLDLFATTKSLPVEMNQMHSIYWVLEASKIGIAGMLLAMCNSQSCD